MLPDIEKVVSDYLRDRNEIAAIVGRRVVGKTPTSTDEPWVKVTQLDGPADLLEHLAAFLIQFDCYAGKNGGQPEANLLQRTVRYVLTEIPGAHDGAVVTGRQIVGASRVPDEELDTPARERVIVTATVWAHS